MKSALLAAVVLLPLAALPAAAADPPALVVAAARDGVVQLDPATGARTRLLVPGASEPAVSPDGTRLVFALPDRSASQLWLSDLDGTHRLRLTSGPALNSTPAWSPDGTQIALTRRAVAGGPSSIALVDADGTHGRLVPGTEGTGGPTWSPDGQLLAFTQVDGRVGLVDRDGRNRTSLDVGGRPDWSPDGRELLLALGGSESSMVRYDLLTHAQRTITEFEGYHVTWQHGDWTPDGRTIYADLLTESFPDENGETTFGYTVERRSAEGVYDSSFDSGPRIGQVATGGGVRPGPDTTAPLRAVSATATAGPMRIDLQTSVPDDPDGAGVVVRYAAGSEPPVTPADGQPGGRSLTGQVQLVHLAPSATYSVSVWPVDWSGNVGPRTTVQATTPRERPTTLDLRSQTGEVTYGHSLVLTGRLLEDGVRPVAGALLTLLGHHSGEPDRVLAQVRTDDRGDVELTRVPSETTRYTLRYAGEGDLLPAVDSGLVPLRAAVRTTLTRGTVRRGQRADLLVQVRPARPGQPVSVTQTLHGTAVRSVRVAQDSHGAVRVPLGTGRSGSYQLEVTAYEPGFYPGLARVPFTVR